MNKQSVIEVRNLTKHYFRKRTGLPAAIDNISFEVGKETVTLLGPSGCGKTTTLRCIAGLERPDSGEIYIEGRLVTSPGKKAFVPPEKRGVGLVFQSYALWPQMKVFDNIAYALKIRHFSHSEIKARVSEVLEAVRMNGFQERYPSELSGGQQQRIALARSLAYKPRVLLLDEPLSNLDAKVRESTRAELKTIISELGISTIYVTHDQEEAFVLSDKIAVMNEGKIIQFDVPYNIYYRPATEFVAKFVGLANIVEGVVASIDKIARKGTIRILSNYDIQCSLTEDLAEGTPCTVTVRSNEIKMASQKPANGNVIEGQVRSRQYKGSVTDYVLGFGSCQLLVTADRFWDNNGAYDEQSGGLKENQTVFVEIRGDAITVVPKSTEDVDKRVKVTIDTATNSVHG